MKRKTIGLAGISMILLASFVLVGPIPSASAVVVENRRYWVMGGMVCGCSDLVSQPPTLNWKTPFQTRPPYLTPMLMSQNITFSDPWELTGYGWIVNLTVPAETYVGLQHAWFDKPSQIWYRMNVALEEDGYGWIFLNPTGDVDCCTFNNYTGVYWGRKNGTFASPLEGQKAADTGALPSPGPDGVAGTGDDGFGDGTINPAGSSILMLSSTMHVDYWTGSAWAPLFEAPWPQVLMTGTAYDIINEPASEINGWNSTVVGKPWEFYAGLDHPEYGHVLYGYPTWNAYVTYVCAWSVLNQDTSLGDLDVIFQIEERKVREDYVIADINGDEYVNIVDIVMAALAFDTGDEGPGEDGIPGTADDKPDADLKYDARGDLRPARGLVNIVDIVGIAINFDWKLTTEGIIGPPPPPPPPQTFEQRRDFLLQQALYINDSLIGEALDILSAHALGGTVRDGGHIVVDGTHCLGLTVFTYTWNDVTHRWENGHIEVTIDTQDPGDGENDGHFWRDSDTEVIKTIVHEARHVWQFYLLTLTKNEPDVKMDLNNDGDTNDMNVPNDWDGDGLPTWVPSDKDFDDWVKDDQPAVPLPWDPDNDGDPLDNDALGRLERDAYRFEGRVP